MESSLQLWSIALLFHLIFWSDAFHWAWVCNPVDNAKPFIFILSIYHPARRGNREEKKTLWAETVFICSAVNGFLLSPKWQLQNIYCLKCSAWQSWIESIVQFSFGSCKRILCHCKTGLWSGLSMNNNHSSRLPQPESCYRKHLSSHYLNSLFGCWFTEKRMVWEEEWADQAQIGHCAWCFNTRHCISVFLWCGKTN